CTRPSRTSTSSCSPAARRRRGWRRPCRATGARSTRRSTEFVAEVKSAGAARRRPWRRRRRADPPAPGDPRNIGWLYVLPALAFYGLFTLGPLVHTVYYSFFSWDGLTAKTYVGLSNYSAALRDSALRSSFAHAGVLILFYALIPVVLGLLLTAALT